MARKKKVDKIFSAELKEPETGEYCYLLWKDRLSARLQEMEQTYFKKWERDYRYFAGDHWKVHEDESMNVPADRITVNMIGSSVLSMVPFLVRHSPKIVLKPTRAEFIQSANLKERLVNNVFKTQDMLKQFKRAVMDGIIIGPGIIKIGWEFKADIPDDETLEIINYEEYVRVDRPYLKRIRPYNFLIDPTAQENDLGSGRWCAEIFYEIYQDVLANPVYNETVIEKLMNGTYSPMFFDRDKSSEELFRTVRLYEVWDKKFMKYYVFMHGVDEPLKEGPWPYSYLSGFPYEMYNYIEVPDKIYGLGLARWVRHQQDELNRVRTTMYNHRRRFNRKYTVLNDSITPSELERLEKGEDGTIIRVDTQDAVKVIDDAQVQQDNYALEGIIKQDFLDLTGIDELVRGGNLPSRTTAKEVSVREDFANMKLTERVAAVDNFLHAIVRKLIQHLENNLTVKEVVAIEGPDGVSWATVTPEDVKVETDLEIESTSKEPNDPRMDQQQAIQVMEIVMKSLPVLEQKGVAVNMGELLRWVFDKMHVTDSARFFPNVPESPTGTMGMVAGMPVGRPGTVEGPQAEGADIKQESVNPVSMMQGLFGSSGGGS